MVRGDTSGYTHPVRRLAFMLISLMVLSFALVPFNTVHAHIDEHDQAVLHGGHLHDSPQAEPSSGAVVTEVDRVVSMPISATDQKSMSLSPSWVPLLWFLVSMTLGLAAIREVFRPPGREPIPLYRRSWRHHPLRGPPLASI